MQQIYSAIPAHSKSWPVSFAETLAAKNSNRVIVLSGEMRAANSKITFPAGNHHAGETIS
jgi:hypothetical protein